ncbi:hypothetical protein CHARACLAT_027039 [Characodon lateralis]|uniref:Uncharacterized protein n=1 Tax=Characodon lateralis TaxID=208331 RepID=A0ABU7F6E8_9TELE|nr:hypothetical protein [Characodon lateralis]
MSYADRVLQRKSALLFDQIPLYEKKFAHCPLKPFCNKYTSTDSVQICCSYSQDVVEDNLGVLLGFQKDCHGVLQCSFRKKFLAKLKRFYFFRHSNVSISGST